jgi:putative transposase
MFSPSPNTPAYYLTSVTKDRLKAFRGEQLKKVACDALNEARSSGKFLIFAYVIMPDHLHAVTNSEKKARVILRFINGIISRRVIDFLKAGSYLASLDKLRRSEDRRGHKYSLWDHHANARVLTSEEMFMQRVNYTHQNPVRAGLVEKAEDYRYSSVRIWKRNPLENEPLVVDVDKIRWRKRNRGAKRNREA